MKELKCPKCNSVFSVDEADYSFILQQVKTAEFNAEVDRRLSELLKNEETKAEMALVKVRSEASDSLRKKDIEIADLKSAVEKKNEELRLALLNKEKEGLEVVATSRINFWISNRNSVITVALRRRNSTRRLLKLISPSKRLRRPNRRFSAARINCALQTIRWMI